MESVREIGPKIKAYGATMVGEWGLIILVILAVAASFGMGRLSVLMGPKPAISVQNAAAVATADPLHLGGGYVASRTGQNYYFPWCAGAQSIATDNQRWFATEAAAQKAGYRPAKNCRGL